MITDIREQPVYSFRLHPLFDTIAQMRNYTLKNDIDFIKAMRSFKNISGDIPKAALDKLALDKLARHLWYMLPSQCFRIFR